MIAWGEWDGTREGSPVPSSPRGTPSGMLFCQARPAWHWASTPGSACSRQLDRLRPRMPGMRSGCVLPAPLPPPTPRTGYSLSREARGHPLYGKTTGHRACGGHRSCPGMGTRYRSAWGGLAPRGSTRRACAGWMFVEDLLRTLCFIHRLILNLTNPIRFSLPGEETETRRGQGTCLRVPAGKCQRQTWSKPV